MSLTPEEQQQLAALQAKAGDVAETEAQHALEHGAAGAGATAEDEPETEDERAAVAETDDAKEPGSSPDFGRGSST